MHLFLNLHLIRIHSINWRQAKTWDQHCVCQSLGIYLFKLQYVFVQITICICQNYKMYLSKLQNVFLSINLRWAKTCDGCSRIHHCVCQSLEIYHCLVRGGPLSKSTNVGIEKPKVKQMPEQIQTFLLKQEVWDLVKKYWNE